MLRLTRRSRARRDARQDVYRAQLVDPTTLCHVLDCDRPWTRDRHGWKTCADH